MKFVLFLTLFVPFFTNAQSLSLEGFQLTLQNPVEPQVDCFDPKTTPVCEEINRSYCASLAASEGNLTGADGMISVGKSKKSQLSEIERTNLLDLIP